MEAEPITSRGGISARILVAVAMGIASGSAVVAVASRSARVLGWFMAAAVSATLVSEFPVNVGSMRNLMVVNWVVPAAIGPAITRVAFAPAAVQVASTKLMPTGR